MFDYNQPAESTYDAASISPVPQPGAAVPTEPYRGIYSMPMFMTLTSGNLEESEDFWTKGLGFINLYAMPGMMIHLRRWAFQDVLIRKSGPNSGSAQTDIKSPGSLSLAVAETQIVEMVEACEKLRPGSTSAPIRMPWNSIEAKIQTPEGLTLTLTAALSVDKKQAEAYLSKYAQ
ncbi:hypothetical protein [Bombiscardovia coagulans]|uniref:Glycosyltransferase n=1 Tax=Bombiscardovia coagulans TaxID=686666 RepID=A0A261ETG7_9BIFI|nr:hypothetical protein [Bombiscardovia coagulans]OZG50148.1 hypothetical protein BOCO_0665 [Bombiscardovia coagulans]